MLSHKLRVFSFRESAANYGIQITKDRYGHLASGTKREAAARLTRVRQPIVSRKNIQKSLLDPAISRRFNTRDFISHRLL